ncbi:hypothetical protein DAMA08_016800 [Martiniozyma asiatica (nom. inval.)]|nr:hypothetical protein DAMA08_016800 [Martiniozyma asiatica]
MFSLPNEPFILILDEDIIPLLLPNQIESNLRLNVQYFNRENKYIYPTSAKSLCIMLNLYKNDSLDKLIYLKSLKEEISIHLIYIYPVVDNSINLHILDNYKVETIQKWNPFPINYKIDQLEINSFSLLPNSNDILKSANEDSIINLISNSLLSLNPPVFPSDIKHFYGSTSFEFFKYYERRYNSYLLTLDSSQRYKLKSLEGLPKKKNNFLIYSPNCDPLNGIVEDLSYLGVISTISKLPNELFKRSDDKVNKGQNMENPFIDLNNIKLQGDANNSNSNSKSTPFSLFSKKDSILKSLITPISFSDVPPMLNKFARELQHEFNERGESIQEMKSFVSKIPQLEEKKFWIGKHTMITSILVNLINGIQIESVKGDLNKGRMMEGFFADFEDENNLINLNANGKNVFNWLNISESIQNSSSNLGFSSSSIQDEKMTISQLSTLSTSSFPAEYLTRLNLHSNFISTPTPIAKFNLGFKLNQSNKVKVKLEKIVDYLEKFAHLGTYVLNESIKMIKIVIYTDSEHLFEKEEKIVQQLMSVMLLWWDSTLVLERWSSVLNLVSENSPAKVEWVENLQGFYSLNSIRQGHLEITAKAKSVITTGPAAEKLALGLAGSDNTNVDANGNEIHQSLLAQIVEDGMQVVVLGRLSWSDVRSLCATDKNVKIWCGGVGPEF